ncbi:MAG: CopD family protein [Candidatus Thermoplasmatota archaeon]|jgi:uncharacterized membrane protein|nr:CopD family protein [Candidatus Thermoplasmatota archaeon]MCL5955184.1 CopD family protein [Candidatus Thermoplasmatota archaeon]
MILLDAIVLAIHIFFAILFVGGSFFIWLVVWPASYEITDDEKERTRIVGKIAKRFAIFTHVSLAVLIVTGIYNATWYLGSFSALYSTSGGEILLAKIVVVGIDILIIYSNNLYHGKKITRLAREGKLEEVKRIRKVTHLFSFISLALLLVIVGLATALQFF